MTFVATASGASLLGATVRFADVDPESGLIDPESVDSLVGDRTRVVAAVDYAGQPCDYPRLQEIADRVGAVTVADAAHSVGGTLDGRPVGDLADVTTFSFFPTKNLTTGEGGAVVAKDPAVARRAREFHNIGLVRDPERFEITDQGPWHQEVHELGVNYRLTDVGCALGLSQLRRLPEFGRRRAEIKQRYDEALAGVPGVATPPQRSGTSAGVAPLPGAGPGWPPPGGLRADAGGRHRGAGQLPAGLLAPGLRAARLPPRDLPERRGVLRAGAVACRCSRASRTTTSTGWPRPSPRSSGDVTEPRSRRRHPGPDGQHPSAGQGAPDGRRTHDARPSPRPAGGAPASTSTSPPRTARPTTRSPTSRTDEACRSSAAARTTCCRGSPAAPGRTTSTSWCG